MALSKSRTGRRRHAVQGSEGLCLGRRLSRAARRPLARAHQARHNQDRNVCVPGLAADICRHAGGAKGNDLKAQIEKGAYPGIVKTTLDGVNQRAYLEGNSDHSARDDFFYHSGSTPSAVRYKNWKMYYSMTQSGAAGWTEPLITFHWTIVANIKRDPFEQGVLLGDAKTLANVQAALPAP